MSADPYPGRPLAVSGDRKCERRRRGTKCITRNWMDDSRALAVLAGMLLRSMFVVFNGMHVVAMRDLGVMRRLFMIVRFVMFCGLAMVLRGLLMMVRRLLMVLMDCVFRHFSLFDFLSAWRWKHRRAR